MGCKCCKDSDPKHYRECQSIIEKIKSMSSSQAQGWRFRAPCGIQYTFGAKFFFANLKKKKEDWIYYTIPFNLFLYY